MAFSGGVDSTLLLKTAHSVLGDKAVAYHASSILQTDKEQARAESLAAMIGCRLEQHRVEPLSWPDFVANPPDRCYLCKKKIFSLFRSSAGRAGIPSVLDGTNLDDLGDDRPGLRALRELGIRSPLLETGLGKEEIRQLSKELGLPTWNQPPSSCLATRIASGLPIGKENLAVVAQCEQYLHSMGFLGCRARYAPDYLAIEVVEGDFEKIVSPEIRARIRRFCKKTGFERIFLNFQGR